MSLNRFKRDDDMAEHNDHIIITRQEHEEDAAEIRRLGPMLAEQLKAAGDNSTALDVINMVHAVSSGDGGALDMESNWPDLKARVQRIAGVRQ